MAFVERRDGVITGCWTVCQWKDQEELPEDNEEVVAFRNRKMPERTPVQKLAAIGLTVDELKALVAGK